MATKRCSYILRIAFGIMGKIELLDCTLRDGGYINDWQFGESAIDFIIKKLEQSGVELIEIGFIKGETFSKDRTVYPDFASINNVVFESTIPSLI